MKKNSVSLTKLDVRDFGKNEMHPHMNLINTDRDTLKNSM